MSAEAFNAFVDAAEARRGSALSQLVDAAAGSQAPGVITVRNDSGSDQDRFAILGLDVPLILPSEHAAAFQERVALSVVLPSDDEHAERFCILQEPLRAGGLGKALLMGVSPVRLSVQGEDDTHASVIGDDSTSLETGPDGTARVIWKEPGTGPKWGLVQIPAGGGDGGAANLVLEVAVPAHGWFVGDVLRWNGAEWVFADAAVIGETDTLAVVGRIPDDDHALLVLWGVFCLDDLSPHTDYWLDPAVPGALTAVKPSDNPRLVLHHGENRLCVLRAGSVGGSGSAARFADLTDVDVTSVPPTDQQAALWDAAAERWKPRSVIVAEPVPAHQVLAGPESGADALPAFRDLAVDDLAELPATSVVANATAAEARPEPLAAEANDRALVRVAGRLQWLQISTDLIEDEAITADKIAAGSVESDALADAAVTSAKIADAAVTTAALAAGAVTDAKIVSLGWGKLTGVPSAFPPTPHEHPLGGALTGTTSNAQIAAGAVGTPELADGGVTSAKLAAIPGPSVLGRAAGAGTPTTLGAVTDGTVLRRSGGVLGFAQITNLEIAAAAAIAWTKISKAGAVAADIGAAALGHTHQLAGLGDVVITNPTVGQVLAYDAINGRWINDEGGGGPGTMRPFSVWVNPTNANAEGTDLQAPATNRVLARGFSSLVWTQVARPMLSDGPAWSIIGRASDTDGPVADITADLANTVLRRPNIGNVGFGKITVVCIDSEQPDGGSVLTSGFLGQPVWARLVTLGSGPGSSSSIQGSLTVVISNTGDYAKISSAGVELYRRSISTVTPLVKLDLNAYGAWSLAKAMGIREIDVCDNGVAKKMLVLASAAY